MAKDMSGVYAEMLTKELVRLRQKHLSTYKAGMASTSRKVRKQGLEAGELISQIERELANRVSQHNLFV